MGFKVVRKIGAGDRQHVRAGLLQIGLFVVRDLEHQVSEVLKASTEMRIRGRIYLNASHLSEDRIEFVNRVMLNKYRCYDHDFLPRSVSGSELDWLIEQLDIVILDGEDGEDDSPLGELLKACWAQSGRGADILEDELNLAHLWENLSYE